GNEQLTILDKTKNLSEIKTYNDVNEDLIKLLISPSNEFKKLFDETSQENISKFYDIFNTTNSFNYIHKNKGFNNTKYIYFKNLKEQTERQKFIEEVNQENYINLFMNDNKDPEFLKKLFTISTDENNKDFDFIYTGIKDGKQTFLAPNNDYVLSWDPSTKN